MTVEVLRLSDLEADDALKAAEKLLDHKAGGPLRLRRLLVLDDADRLVEHEPVYRRLETGRRVADTLCVAAGPFGAADGDACAPGRPRRQPGDRRDLGRRRARHRLAAGRAHRRRPGRTPGSAALATSSSCSRTTTCSRASIEAFREAIPGKVASPGLWLAGADAEDATFAAALAVADRTAHPVGPAEWRARSPGCCPRRRAAPRWRRAEGLPATGTRWPSGARPRRRRWRRAPGSAGCSGAATAGHAITRSRPASCSAACAIRSPSCSATPTPAPSTDRQPISTS